MAELVRTIAAGPGDLSLLGGTYTVGGENRLPFLSSGLHMCVVLNTLRPEHKNNA